MVSTLDSGSSGRGSSTGEGHGVVFLGKTLSLCLSSARSINGYQQTVSQGKPDKMLQGGGG